MSTKLFDLDNKNLLAKALTNKIHELEFQSKKGIKYLYGNNEEYISVGQQILEFLFYDYMIINGYPNPETQFKKGSDIILLRQKLLCEKNLAEIAQNLRLPYYMQVGNQKALKNNTKAQSETLKALIAAHYYDKGFDLEQMREITTPLIQKLLDKGQAIRLNELKHNAKSAFLEYITGFTLAKPKVSVEWSKQQQLNGNQENLYNITLELEQIKVNKQGNNKRNTEQLVYQEALKELRQNQLKLISQQQEFQKKKKKDQNCLHLQEQEDISTQCDFSEVNNSQIVHGELSLILPTGDQHQENDNQDNFNDIMNQSFKYDEVLGNMIDNFIHTLEI